MNLFNIEKTFIQKKEKGWPEIYFCIDLHGTIIPSGHSASDEKDALVFYPNAMEVLQWMSYRKDIFITLWTSTPRNRISPVIDFFEKHEIFFNFINENPHAKDTPRSDFSKKFYFNCVLDDRAGFDAHTDWGLIKEKLIEIGEWK